MQLSTPVLFRIVRFIAMAAVVLSVDSAKPQSVIQVPTNFPTIQSAINAASNGDTVLVAPGTYVENINFSGKAITLTSSSGPAVTIIDGNHNGTVVTFNHSETASSVLSGFTIQNGLQDGGFGAGITVSSASPTITSNVIARNHAAAAIGIYVNGGSPLITNNTNQIHFKQHIWWSVGREYFTLLDLRAQTYQTIRGIQRSSVDYYSSLRSLYRQLRADQIANGRKQNQDLPDF